MSATYNKIISVIDNRLRVFMDSLKFDKTYYGKIISIIDNLSMVEINGVEYKSKIRDGLNVKVGDIVIIKSPNKDMNSIYIDGKLGGVGENVSGVNIANNLTTTTTGSALDAVQGKVLDGKIEDLSTKKSDKTYVDNQCKTIDNKVNDLSTNRGYGNSKIISESEFGAKRENGIYTKWGGSSRPFPDLAYTTILSTLGQDVSNIAEIALDCTGLGLAYRGGRHSNNPTWLRIMTEVEMNARGLLNTKGISNSNIDILLENGIYMGENLIGTPHAAASVWWIVEVSQGPANNTLQTITYMVGGNFIKGTKMSRIRSNGVWEEWKYEGVNTVQNISLLNGWTNFDTTSRYCISGNIVTVNMRIKGGVITNGTVLCNLPKTDVGAIFFSGMRSGTNSFNGIFSLKPNGQFVVYSNGDDINNIDITLNFSYVSQKITTQSSRLSYKELETIETEYGIFTNNEQLSKTAQDVYEEWLLIKDNPPTLKPTHEEQIKNLEGKVEKMEVDNLNLLSTTFDLDFRVMDIEDIILASVPTTMSLEDNKPIMRGASKMALTPYEMAKTLILAGEYEREDMEYKLGRYLARKRITESEFNELIALMDAQELI